MKGLRNAPYWWEWELVLSIHLERRMVDRRFTELDLRRMLHRATSVEPDHAADRFAVTTKHRGQRWCVVLEPTAEERCVVVITAYPTE